MEKLIPEGQRYLSEIPNTLDLAERAKLAINGLTGVLDPGGIHEMHFIVNYMSRPPLMYKDTTGFPTNNPKFAESLPMMRIMCGSEQNLHLESAMMEAMLACIGEDGLYYAIASPQRPWHEGVGHQYPKTGEDFANVYGNARMILALMAWYQRDNDPKLWTLIENMAKGLAGIAIRKEDYAYYPDGKIGEAFSRPRSGWRDITEPEVEKMGAEGSMFMYHGGQIRAFSRWAEMSGKTEYLDIAAALIRFVLKPKFWGVEGEVPWLLGKEHGHFTGHFHGHLSLLRGLLEYGWVTRQPQLLDFVRESYEFCRHYGIPQIGWFANTDGYFTEGCTCADMVALACQLSRIGCGDYWEDVEAIVRNHLVQHQITNAERLAEISAASPPLTDDGTMPIIGSPNRQPTYPNQVCTDRVIDRTLGIFAGVSKPDGLRETWSMQCCTGNGSQALYYAWESILQHERGYSQINLLLNRASPWLDIFSELPYQGRVLIQNKRSERIAVHIPRWVERDQMKVYCAGKRLPSIWVGNYSLIQGLTGGEEIVFEFPMVESTRQFEIDGRRYDLRLRGNDLIEIRSSDPSIAYPFYTQPEKVEKGAGRITVERYVTETIIPW